MQKKIITYNAFQLMALYNRRKINVWEVGRGGGKSTAMGRHIIDMVMAMPRSIGVMVGETYQNILNKMLPSTILGLEQHGWIKGIHFYVCKKPPKSWGWPEPYQPPDNYNQGIIFFNGTYLHFLSQDRGGVGAGLNSDWVIAGEAAKLDKAKLDTDAMNTCRSSFKKAFQGHPLLGCKLIESSSPLTLDGRWMFDFEQLAIDKPDECLFLRAPSMVNSENLMDGWFDDVKKSTLDWIYDVEILNKRLKAIGNGFYSFLDEDKHTYQKFKYSFWEANPDAKPTCRGDGDLDPFLPLSCGIDWGAAINCMAIAQLRPNRVNWLKNLYVLGTDKEGIDELADKFADYYEYHKTKTLYAYYDNTGNNRQANSQLSYAKQFAKRLKARGWTVILKTKGGTNPQHAKKYLLWQNTLRELDPRIPVHRFNKSNCRELIASMQNAPAIQGKGSEFVRKDKRSERRASVPRQLATDLSDAADALWFGVGEKYLAMSNEFYDPTW